MDKEKATQFLKEVRNHCESQRICANCLFFRHAEECVFKAGKNPEDWKFVDECEKIIL